MEKFLSRGHGILLYFAKQNSNFFVLHLKFKSEESHVKKLDKLFLDKSYLLYWSNRFWFWLNFQDSHVYVVDQFLYSAFTQNDIPLNIFFQQLILWCSKWKFNQAKIILSWTLYTLLHVGSGFKTGNGL